MNRRYFLKGAAVAMAGIGSAPAWLARAAAAVDGKQKKVLVAIFQRGAMDGLNAVVPYGESRYYDLRPNLAIPKPGGDGGCLDLDGSFGLHPSLAPLHALYKSGRLAIVEAAGSHDTTRSHFDAQDYMESGTPGMKSTRDGWLNRALAPAKDPSPVRAVAVSSNLARTLRGSNPAVALQTLREFQVRDASAASDFASMYAKTQDTQLKNAAHDTFEAIRIVQGVEKQPYQAANGASYANSKFAQSMLQIARLIKAGVGLEVAFADMGGWDTHVNQPQQLANLLREFAGGINAFVQDLGTKMDDVLLVTMSEFGRTAKENGTRGTDHGRANAMFVIGGSVKGGKIHGRWPGLGSDALYEGRDLAVTTDFRDVLSEAVAKHLGNSKTSHVFPSYQPKPLRILG